MMPEQKQRLLMSEAELLEAVLSKYESLIDVLAMSGLIDSIVIVDARATIKGARRVQAERWKRSREAQEGVQTDD